MEWEGKKYKPGENFLTLTDSYKFTHWPQYPPKTTKVYSYFESRGGLFDHSLFFGLQYQMEEYLQGKVVTPEKIDYAEKFVDAHLGPGKFNRKGWEYILDKHGGMLPLSIRAVPEGTVVPYRNVLMAVENTDPNCYWLTNYAETLLVQLWYPITVATQSLYIKQRIEQELKLTGSPKFYDSLSFKLHDFGFRGASSVESAAIGGAAHLVNFKGTDNSVALELLMYYYNSGMAGFSIPAAEHSTLTSWGRENEADALKNMLDQFPKGAVAVVSDAYDIFNACKEIWGTKLKKQVLGREGVLVIRPDSGDPPVVILQVLDILAERFGFDINEKGYRTLNEKVRIIQGDGIDHAMVDRILNALTAAGWSADNLVFGSGGGLLQKMNRDTLKFAFKCSYVEVNGEGRNVFKDPITDRGKMSKQGILKLVESSDGFKTVSKSELGADALREVFRDGKVLVNYKFDEIRSLAESNTRRIRIPA
ncbi:MAG: nicotinate phosphoribosyltransferase [Candidatus Micrarchaeota archaeon]|nr:nicotinate phosphoribosyltransferase [Candidatus Micrarchaeota archaeon]